MKRNRILYAVLAAACIGLGLASRAFRADLPAFLGEYAGDTIWAMMVYFLFAVLLARKPVWLVSLCALVFSYGIEFSQIYHAPWIDSVRATTLGGLVLGQGFLVSDLICYAAGILIALLIDTLIEGIRRRNTPPKRQNRYIK